MASTRVGEILFLEEVSAQHKIPAETLRYWRKNGTGPKSFKLGRRVVYLASDVDEWIRQARAAAS